MIPAIVMPFNPLDWRRRWRHCRDAWVIIPPSIPMVTKVGPILDGDLLSPVSCRFMSPVLVSIVFWWPNIDWGGEPTSLKKVFTTGKDALLALMMPLIIVGGIYGGVFTPTEAAAVATVYALIVGMVIFKEITIADLRNVILKAAVSSAVVLFVIATSSSFSWLLTSLQIPEKVASTMLSISNNPTVILLLLNIILLFLGSFLETQAIILLVTPIIFPLAMNLGVDPLVLGIIIWATLPPA